MNRSLTVRLRWVVAMGMFVGLVAVLAWLAFPGKGQGGSSGGIKKAPLYRLAASSWNSTAFSTSASPFGRLFYDRTLPVKSTAYKALYVTVTGTAHQTNGDILALTCTLNGSPCDAYGKVRVANTGANSWLSNSFSQTWCVTPGGNEQHLQLVEFADSDLPPTNTVYIEHVNVIVDASSTTDACSTQGFVTS